MANTSTIPVISAKTASSKSAYKPPHQSANTLFHFIEELEYLLLSLEKEALIPRYCVESVEYLDIPFKSIAYPMICFCDINLHKIEEHIELYGGYGIAFSKEWGINEGIQPVQYLNENSHLHNDFSEAFKMAISSSNTDKAQDYLLSHMLFVKPIEGDMLRNGGLIHKNFTDECEWRFIPEVTSEGLPIVLPDSELVQKDTLNLALANAHTSWLRFSADDIKYLIMKNRTDFEEVLKIIIRKKRLSETAKYKLASKIIIWDEARGDF